MNSNIDSSFYKAELALRPDVPCYVERKADSELLRALLDAKLTVILASRKVGKSSLVERAFASLREGAVFVAKKELAEADEGVTGEKWYYGLINELVNDALLRNDFTVDSGWQKWWDDNTRLSLGQRFTDFLRKFFLESTSQSWVIGIDEIDTTIPLPFSDDFFAAIRRCQNARAADPLWERLTFLLAGVASPAQLIKDNRRTPFNIGYAVSLTDFTADEAKVLLEGLGEPVDDAAHPALQRILHWTGGHPYLTQRVFLKLAEDLEASKTRPTREDWSSLVDQAVHDSFLQPGARVIESHLEDIARRRIGDLDKPSNPQADPELKRHMLAIYERALADKPVEDEPQSKPCVELKLCGLLITDKADPSRLVVRNLIYRTVFDAIWVRSEMPQDQSHQVAAVTRRYIFARRLTVAALLMGVLVSGNIWALARQARIGDLVSQIERAETDVPTDAVSELRSYSGQEERAQELLAGYWARRGRVASVERPRDEAAIVWLKALSVHEIPEARLQARRVLSGSLPNVHATLRHGDGIFHAEFGDDRRSVITVSGDQTERVWELENGQPKGLPSKEFALIKHLTNRSRNGNQWERSDLQSSVTISDNNDAWIYSLGTAGGIGPLQHEGLVLYAAFSPDGRQIVTASADKTARVWDAESGQPRSSPLQHQSPVVYAAFSADGRQVVTASEDKTARVWDVESGQALGSPLLHQFPLHYAAFSSDESFIVTCSDDKATRVWDVKSGKLVGIPLQHQLPVKFAVFSEDGQRVVTVSLDNTAQVWNVETGQLIGNPLRHAHDVVLAEFSVSGRYVVTADGGTSRVWDANTGRAIGSPLTHQSSVAHAEFSADESRVVTASGDRPARVWEVETDQPLGSPLKHENTVNFAKFSTDGRRVVTYSSDNTARVWDAETGQPLGSPLKHNGSVIDAEFRTDGRRVVTASRDNTARIWDVATGKPLGNPLSHDGPVFLAEFSADGRRVVTLSGDKTARVWNAETGQPIGRSLRHEEPVARAELSWDGRTVVTASGDTARVWDAEMSQPIGSPLKHDKTVIHVAFSADGRRVVTASFDNTAQVWDAATGQPLGSSLEHQGPLRLAAFSADGRRVVTASFDNTAQVWDAETCKPLGSPLKHHGRVQYAAFSADGRRVVTATANAVTWHFEPSPGIWKPQATVWANGGSWVSSPQLMIPTGEKIRIADSWTGDTLLIRDLFLQEPENGLPELTGTAEELLAKYLQRFSLKFEDDQKSPTLRPAFYVGSPQNDGPLP